MIPARQWTLLSKRFTTAKWRTQPPRIRRHPATNTEKPVNDNGAKPQVQPDKQDPQH